MITLKIDVKLLQKERFKPFTRKDGSQGLNCELVIFNTKKGLLVKQQVTKEERLARVEMPILGNAKDWDKQEEQPAERPQTPSQPESDDVPF